MKTKLMLTAATTLACSFVAVQAKAAVYDLNTGFGTAHFQYGQGVGGATFIEFSNIFSCNGSLVCFNNNADYPNISYNPTDQQFSVFFGNPFGTLAIPAYGIDLSTGVGVNPDTIVRFIAPSAGQYSLSGNFSWLVTNNGFSDGVQTSIYRTSGAVVTTLTSAVLAQGPQFTGFAFSLDSVSLAPGDFLDFVVNNNGSNGFDAIGLFGVISTAAVPEPATWAMMIGGFGMVGGAFRYRRGFAASRA